MNKNLDNILSKAANSNLTATALEFVPRSTTFAHSRPGPSSTHHKDDYRNGRHSQLSGQDVRNDREERNLRHDYQNRYRTNYKNQHQPERHERRRYHDQAQDHNSYHYNVSQSNRDDFSSSNNVNHEYLESNSVIHGNYENFKESTPIPNSNDSHSGKANTSLKPVNRSYNSEESERIKSSKSRSYKAFNHKPHVRGNNLIKSSDCKHFVVSVNDDLFCQRDRLIEQLNKGSHECLICCEVIKQREPVWNCGNCYYVLHMWCIIVWARSSTADTNCWRCPACQYEHEKVPEKYMCFCGKTKLYTEWNRQDTAHSCGEVCGRCRENPTPWFVCEHKCTLLCHPGPCPPCTIQVIRECGCGRTQQSVQCSAKTEILCGTICDRLLNCGVHRCTQTCHFGECQTCKMKIEIACHCEKQTIERTCGIGGMSKFSCEQTCGRMLSCGNHFCEEICHENECGLCPRAPIVLNTCACGKTTISENTRQSCLDEVPTCCQPCGKIMKCGPPNRRHICDKPCHEGECGPCSKKTTIKCRCGALGKTFLCVEMNSKDTDFRCQKKCMKKRSCGKHKCNQICCIDIEHICAQRCNASLSCGKHRCELLCHRGKCGRCLQSSFEELYCHCGHSVIYPPVPCGTKPPACDQPCQRQHDCEHEPLHTCHSDRTCPPCTVFTDKLCYGGHELRKTIPCYQKEFSCGLPCRASLPCGFHVCQIPCHAGDCSSIMKKCIQPCSRPRDLCGHPCNAPCHTTSICPKTLCKEMVTVTCACGNIVAKHPCHEHTDDYRRIITATLASKMAELQTNDSVIISDVNEKITAQTINLRTLECTDECKLIMRNRRLALALQIQNPDMNAKFTPKYSDYMKSWAKKDPNLCRHIHDRLTALVKEAKESRQKSRSFSFEIMNKEKRQLVHEYCAHFGCESEAYDAEPKRNVVAIATKGRCWLPSYSLLEVIQRETGQRKVPAPVINRKTNMRDQNFEAATSTRFILPVLPSSSTASSSNGGINYFGD